MLPRPDDGTSLVYHSHALRLKSSQVLLLIFNIPYRYIAVEKECEAPSASKPGKPSMSRAGGPLCASRFCPGLPLPRGYMPAVITVRRPTTCPRHGRCGENSRSRELDSESAAWANSGDLMHTGIRSIQRTTAGKHSLSRFLAPLLQKQMTDTTRLLESKLEVIQ